MSAENFKEWVWDSKETTHNTLLKHNNEEVCFHPSYSSGTAAVRGNMPMTAGRDYFWEIEMCSPLYGTDVMVGVGTKNVDLKRYQFQFGSLLGCDTESWGYSYNGRVNHNGMMIPFSTGFSQGNIVGVHLDMWNGTLAFYLNRQPIGVAFTSLKPFTLYPMVCSTAARSVMRIVCSYSYTSSLQLFCLKALGTKPELMEKVHSIPGLRIYEEKAFWHFFPRLSTSFLGGHKINNLYCDDEDSDIEDRFFFSHAVFAGKFRQAHLVTRPMSKRSSDTDDDTDDDSDDDTDDDRDSDDSEPPEPKRDLCSVCQRPERTSGQSTSGQGSSSKQMGGDPMEDSSVANRSHLHDPIIINLRERTVELYLDNN